MRPFLFSLLAIGMSFIADAQEYKYPVVPGTTAWKSINSHDEMIKVCQLPDDYLQKATSRDLFQTCLNYPLLFDILSYENPAIGFEKVSKQFNGFAEFFKRNDAAEAVFQTFKKNDLKSIIAIKDENDKGRATLLLSILDIILTTEPILAQTDSKKKLLLLEEFYTSYQFKEKEKETFGSIGIMTSSYGASKVLTSLNDQTWLNRKAADKKIAQFSDNMFLSTPETMEEIMTNVKRKLKL